MTDRSPGRKARSKPKLALSMILGLALVPLSAVGAVLVSEHRPEPVAEAASEAVPVAQAAPAAQPVPTIPQFAYSDVEATAEDLEYACGEGGLELVAAESEGAITEMQQSALDALRAICESQGMALPGKEAPPPIVQTRTVTVQAPAPQPAAAQPTVTTIPTDDDESETSTTQTTVPANTTTTAPKTTQTTVATTTPGTAPMGTQERYEAVYAQAVTEIEQAVAAGGSLEKISEANEKLEEARRAAAGGHYEEATTQAYEAIGKAREAVGEGGG